MRVLMTTDTVGGVWTYSTELSEGLLEHGESVLLVTVGPPPGTEQRAWLHAVQERWPGRVTFADVDAPLEWMEAGGDAYRAGETELLRLCEEFRPDIVHCNQFCYGALSVGPGVAKVVVAHSDVLSWWRARYASEMPDSSWRDEYVAQVEAGLAGADVVGAPSAASLAELRESFDFVTEARVLWNGRTTAAADTSDAGLLRGKVSQAMTCGRLWDEGKNAGLLERVEHPPLPFLIAGEAMREETTAPRLNASCSFSEKETTSAEPQMPTYTGRLSPQSLEQLMRSSAIYIVTSRYEPFGLAAVEAAQAGCAIVASDLASQREIWADAALYFKNGSPASLGEVLTLLAGDPDLLRSTALRGRARALQQFSREAMVRRYASLYRELVSQRSSGRPPMAARGARVA